MHINLKDFFSSDCLEQRAFCATYLLKKELEIENNLKWCVAEFLKIDLCLYLPKQCRMESESLLKVGSNTILISKSFFSNLKFVFVAVEDFDQQIV